MPPAQHVAVTGSWCEHLPSAGTALWRAQQGYTRHPDCMVGGDCLYELAHAYGDSIANAGSSRSVDVESDVVESSESG